MALAVEPDLPEILEHQRIRGETHHVRGGHVEERVFADDEPRLQLVPALLELEVDLLPLFLVELFAALVDQLPRVSSS